MVTLHLVIFFSFSLCFVFSDDSSSLLVASFIWSLFIFAIHRMSVSELSKFLTVLAASPAWDILKKLSECLISFVSSLCCSHLVTASPSSSRSGRRRRRRSRRSNNSNSSREGKREATATEGEAEEATATEGEAELEMMEIMVKAKSPIYSVLEKRILERKNRECR